MSYATCSGVVAYVMCLDCRTCLLANSVLYYNNVLYYEVVEDAMKTDEPSEEAEMAELADRAIRLIRSMTIIFILIYPLPLVIFASKKYSGTLGGLHRVWADASEVRGSAGCGCDSSWC